MLTTDVPVDRSDGVITDILGSGFLTDVLGREHRFYPGPPERFAGLLNWTDLTNILTCHRLRSPQLRLVRAATVLPESAYLRPEPGRRNRIRVALDRRVVERALADGHTMALRYVEELHPPLAELAAAFERRLHQEFEFNAYASFTETEGFGAHWDDHDVFVLQLAGAKRWRLYGRSELSLKPRDAGKETPPDTLVDDVVLTAGDLLYLPRGHWHAPTACPGEPSLHVTGSAAAATGMQFASWVLNRLRHHDTLCADVPRFTDGRTRAAYLREVGEVVTAALGEPELLDRYLAETVVADRGQDGSPLPLPPTPNHA